MRSTLPFICVLDIGAELKEDILKLAQEANATPDEFLSHLIMLRVAYLMRNKTSYPHPEGLLP